MKFSVEYKRTTRLAAYETLTVGLVEEAEGNEYDRQATFQAVKGQVEKWIKEAADELMKDDAAGRPMP